jgi:hypothetical protein
VIDDEETLSCPAHPDGAEEGCAACDAVLDALERELEQVGDTLRPPEVA